MSLQRGVSWQQDPMLWQQQAPSLSRNPSLERSREQLSPGRRQRGASDESPRRTAAGTLYRTPSRERV